MTDEGEVFPDLAIEDAALEIGIARAFEKLQSIDWLATQIYGPDFSKKRYNGMPTGEEVRMFDTQTQRWLSPDSPAAIPEASKRKIGQVYDTPKGKMVWRGNGWEAA